MITFECTKDIEYLWKVRAYGIFAQVADESEISLVRCAHSFDFCYKNTECVNTVQSTLSEELCLLCML